MWVPPAALKRHVHVLIDQWWLIFRDPGIDYLTIEPYDVYWAKVGTTTNPHHSMTWHPHIKPGRG